MTLKQKLFFLLLPVLGASTVAAIIAPQSVQALDAEACYTTYDGIVKAYVEDAAGLEQYRAYKATFQADGCGTGAGGPCTLKDTYVKDSGAAGLEITCTKPADEGSTSGSSCGGVDTAIVTCSDDEASSGGGIWGLLLLVINIFTAGVAIVAIGGIIYGSILYASAGDSSAQVQKAMAVIRNVVIGIIAYAGMYAILQFLVPGGVFNRAFVAPKVTPAVVRENEDGGGSETSKGSSSEKKVNTTAIFTFQNLGYENVPAEKVFQVIEDKMKKDKGNNFYNFAEIDAGGPGEGSALEKVFGADAWTGKGTQVPIIGHVNDEWRFAGNETLHLHDATGGGSGPARKLTIRYSVNRKNPETKLAVLNTHFVNNAYGGSNQQQRLRVFWDTAWRKTQDKVNQLHSDGYDVVITGDFNRQDVPLFHKNMKLIARHGPDRIFALPAPDRKMAATGGEFFTPSGEKQHIAIWARITFSGGGGRSNSDQPTTSGSVRLKNFRDASVSTNGNVLKSGVLYRSSQLNEINDLNLQRLATVLDKNTLILDVRTAPQASREPNKKIPQTVPRNVPIEGLLDQLEMVTDSQRRTQVGVALRAAANANSDVLVHCMHGKDRTGWIVAMIMYANGATDAQVMAEYMESQEAWPGEVKRHWLNSGLDEAKKRYGSINGYLKRGAGLSDSDINKLRQKFGASNELR